MFSGNEFRENALCPYVEVPTLSGTSKRNLSDDHKLWAGIYLVDRLTM